jgi:hypothetical protein
VFFESSDPGDQVVLMNMLISLHNEFARRGCARIRCAELWHDGLHPSIIIQPHVNILRSIKCAVAIQCHFENERSHWRNGVVVMNVSRARDALSNRPHWIVGPPAHSITLTSVYLPTAQIKRIGTPVSSVEQSYEACELYHHSRPDTVYIAATVQPK